LAFTVDRPLQGWKETKGVSANRLQSGSIPGPPTWNLAGRASRGASPHPVAIPEPDVVIPEVELFSIFWLSVEEEVLLSAPTPGGEVYLGGTVGGLGGLVRVIVWWW